MDVSTPTPSAASSATASLRPELAISIQTRHPTGSTTAKQSPTGEPPCSLPGDKQRVAPYMQLTTSGNHLISTPYKAPSSGLYAASCGTQQSAPGT